MDKRAGEVIDRVEHARRDDQVEARGFERQRIFVRLHAGLRRGKAGAGIAGNHLHAACAEGGRKRSVSTSEVERLRERAGDQIEPREQSFHDRVTQKGMLGEARRGPIATQSAQRSTENFGDGHGGLVPAAPSRDKSAMGDAASLAIAAVRIVRRTVAAIVAFALPPRCPGCGVVVQADHSFCLACWQSLDFMGRPSCSVCAEPLELAFHADARCGACLADPPPFDQLRAAVAYGPIARALALKLKYGRRPGIAVTMARQMRRAAGGALKGALIAPVPLHRGRMWRRGYNQAALIAQAVAREHGDRDGLTLDLIRRPRSTPSLRGLGRLARARAVQGAFALNPAEKLRVKGREVVLIDDVFTSGATAGACARVLKRAGAARVTILCWARVVRDEQSVR